MHTGKLLTAVVLIQRLFQLQQQAFSTQLKQPNKHLKESYPHINKGLELINGQGYPKQQFVQGTDTRDVMNIGSPQQIIEKILYQYELFGHQRYIAQMDFGGVPFELLAKNIELIGTEILPAIKKYTAQK